MAVTRRRRNRARETFIGLVVTVLLVGGAWWLVWHRSEPEASPSVTPTLPPGSQEVTVDHAIDGDSLEVRAISADGPVIKTAEPGRLPTLALGTPQTPRKVAASVRKHASDLRGSDQPRKPTGRPGGRGAARARRG